MNDLDITELLLNSVDAKCFCFLSVIDSNIIKSFHNVYGGECCCFISVYTSCHKLAIVDEEVSVLSVRVG